MRNITGRNLAAVVALAALLGGCSGWRLPFAMGPELTPDEMRKKHGEAATYQMEEPEGKAQGAAASAAPTQGTGKFAVSPDLLQAPPVRLAAISPGVDSPRSSAAHASTK